MALTECPECGTVASTEATFCPQCGFPIRKAAEPDAAGPRGMPFVPFTMLDVTKSIAARLVLGLALMWTGFEFEAPPAAVFGLLAWGSTVPLYLRARKAYKLGPLAGNRALEEAVTKQLAAARDETQRQLATVDQNANRIAELEERVDFMERLLARERERLSGGERLL